MECKHYYVPFSVTCGDGIITACQNGYFIADIGTRCDRCMGSLVCSGVIPENCSDFPNMVKCVDGYVTECVRGFKIEHKTQTSCLQISCPSEIGTSYCQQLMGIGVGSAVGVLVVLGIVVATILIV